MKYIVSLAVEGRIDIEVDEADLMDAQEAALEGFATADLNKMEVIRFFAVNAETEDGKFQDLV